MTNIISLTLSIFPKMEIFVPHFTKGEKKKKENEARSGGTCL
jgi:hypothetical protein